MSESNNKWWIIGGVAALGLSAFAIYKLSGEEEAVKIEDDKDKLTEALE